MSKSRFGTTVVAPARAKDRANHALDALTTPGHRTRYFDSVPVTEMIVAVEVAGFEIDPDERQMILCGREGRVVVPLRWAGREVRHALVFTWYKMEATGRYEVVAYVS